MRQAAHRVSAGYRGFKVFSGRASPAVVGEESRDMRQPHGQSVEFNAAKRSIPAAVVPAVISASVIVKYCGSITKAKKRQSAPSAAFVPADGCRGRSWPDVVALRVIRLNHLVECAGRRAVECVEFALSGFHCPSHRLVGVDNNVFLRAGATRRPTRPDAGKSAESRGGQPVVSLGMMLFISPLRSGY